MTADAEILDVILTIAEHPKSEYTDTMDRYREFRQLFMGTEAGQRVFNEIMIQGRMLTNNAAKGDPYETYLREGKRDLAITIAKLTLEEPTANPTHQVSTNPQEG